MTERVQSLPAEVIREDRQLEAAADNASVALGKLRWHWTTDEDNPERVSLRTYARSVGRHHAVIYKDAQAYVRYTASVVADEDISYGDVRERLHWSVDSTIAIDAVADANETSFGSARRTHKDTVREVKHAVEDEAERREERGQNFPAEEKEDYARKVAEKKRQIREAEERHRNEQRKRHNAMFLEVDAMLSKARRELKGALDAVREAEFTDEEVALLERQNEAVQGMSRLLASALIGDSGTDWDAELLKLEERRQHG